MKQLGLTILLLTLMLCGFAADGYNIKIKINNLKNKEVYLANYYGDKQYIKDTLTLDNKGMATITDSVPHGIYLIVFENKSYFDFIINEKQFSIENDTTKYVENFKSTGSKENEVFYSDLRFIQLKGKARQKLEAKLKQDLNDKEKGNIKTQLKALDTEVKNFRVKLIADNPDLFYTKFLKMLQEPEIPEAPKDGNGDKIDPNFEYYYFKSHYFDNIDLGDGRLLRTPVLHKKVMYYLNNVTVMHWDSIIVSVDHIIELAEPSDEQFKFWLVSFLNKYAKDKLMCMDAVYVHLALNYYCNGKVWWVDKADKVRICENANKLAPTLCKKQTPTLKLRDFENKWHNLYDIKSEFTLLYFYADDCGHCKKEVPKIVEELDTLMGLYDITVVWVNTKHLLDGYKDDGAPNYSTDPKDVGAWKKFVEDRDMNKKGMINLADRYANNNFRHEYDINSTPRPFLLDKDKKILAKRFGSEQIKDLLKQYKEIIDREREAEIEKLKNDAPTDLE